MARAGIPWDDSQWDLTQGRSEEPRVGQCAQAVQWREKIGKRSRDTLDREEKGRYLSLSAPPSAASAPPRFDFSAREASLAESAGSGIRLDDHRFLLLATLTAAGAIKRSRKPSSPL
jgi:hypothetical protein